MLGLPASAGGNDLGGGLSDDGPVQLVLDRGVEFLGDRSVGIVVAAGGVDIADLLIEATFRSADVADALEQFVEVVLPERLLGGLEAFVVEDEALDEILPQGLSSPAAELGASWGPDTVADGEDGFKVVALRPVVLAIGRSY